MELNYDWRAFQSIFSPVDAAPTQMPKKGDKYSHLFLVVDDEKVVSQYTDLIESKDWVGYHLRDVYKEWDKSDITVMQREEVDHWICESRKLKHYYAQNLYLRQKAKSRIKLPLLQKNINRDHFLLEALKGWWRRFFPTSYGIFIRLEGNRTHDFLLVIRLGVFDLFHEPDLAALGDRSRQSQEVVRYLSEKHMVPVQGMFLAAVDWTKWSGLKDPWRQVSNALWTNRLRLYPKPFGLRFLIKLRAWFGL